MTRHIGTAVISVILALLSTPGAQSEPLTNVIIGFTGTDLKRINLVDGQLSDTKPGWLVELANRVGHQCGHTVSFQQMPWKRLLKEVAMGNIWAATNSSYKEERTEFGQYPMRDGQPDEDRALSRYKYVAIVRKGENPDILATAVVPGKKYLAERSSSVVSILSDKGAVVQEVADYDLMLKMLVGGRADSAAIIDGALEDVFSRQPEHRDVVEISHAPIIQRTGYLMFSKLLYEEHSEIIECFWTTSAQLTQSDWYREKRQSYEN